MSLHALQQTVPTVVPVVEDLLNQWDQVVVKLVKRQISWGTANESGKLFASSYKSAILVGSREVMANLEASHQAEVAQRVAIAGAIVDVAASATSAACTGRR